tara:strand:+ start:16287 stop:16679 length:393 start_codon:yes stop_codon:yes gene_type:complete
MKTPIIVMNDTYISIALILILICHLAAFIIGYKMHKTTLIISYINAIVVLGILIFWVNKNLNIQQHHFEFREALALCLEACILIFALFYIVGFHMNSYIKVINYIGFALHLLATIGLLIFILVFKFNRLF